MKKIISELVVVNEKASIMINEEKTKYMSNKNEGKIYIKESNTETVQKMETELYIRKQKAWMAYWSFRQVSKSKMSISSKVNILESCVLILEHNKIAIQNTTNYTDVNGERPSRYQKKIQNQK